MSLTKEMEQQLKALRELRAQGRLTHEAYAKTVVGLCVNYTRAGLVREAVEILKGVPASYFADRQLEDMAEDSAYCAVAIEVAEAVRGHLLLVPEINMPGGDA